MYYTTKELKQLIQANGLEIDSITNAVKCNTEYIDNPDYNPDAEEFWQRGSRYIEKKIPITHSYIFSEWWIGVKIKYRGYLHYMWFRGWHPTEDRPVQWWFDHIWNPGPGKKVRRDGQRNLADKLEKKAGVKYYSRPLATIKYNGESDSWDVFTKGELLLSNQEDMHLAAETVAKQGYRIEIK